MGGDPSRVRVTGPLAVVREGFTGELARLGYKPNAAADQLRLMAHLSRWMDAGHLEAAALTPQVTGAFLAARRAEGYVLWLSPKGLAPLLGYLRRLGEAPQPPSAPATSAGVLLERYRRYLVTGRGLAATTARGCADMVRPFLAGREDAGGLGLGELTAAEVTAFVLASCPGMPKGSAKLTVTALRSLLGFLHVEGLIGGPLGQHVPSVASWRLAGLPRALDPGQVAALLDSCDQRTSVGRRDFAMLTLLARLGLRAGEVAALALEDIDWRAGEITVHGKGSRAERLPLPADAGEAIALYGEAYGGGHHGLAPWPVRHTTAPRTVHQVPVGVIRVVKGSEEPADEIRPGRVTPPVAASQAAMRGADVGRPALGTEASTSLPSHPK